MVWFWLGSARTSEMTYCCKPYEERFSYICVVVIFVLLCDNVTANNNCVVTSKMTKEYIYIFVFLSCYMPRM